MNEPRDAYYATQAYACTNPPPGSSHASESQHTMMQRLTNQETRQITHSYDDQCDPPHLPPVDSRTEAAKYMPAGDAGGEHYPPPHVIPADFDPKEAFKDDSKKIDLSLLPYHPLKEIAEVLEFGAKKYSRDNWRKGFAHERLMAAILRHALAYNEGETYDPETGLCHLAHLGCMLLFLMETRHTHPELDYRRAHETE